MSYTLPKIIAIVSLLLTFPLAFIENERLWRSFAIAVLYETTLALLFVIQRLEG